jgi:uncharacterized protein (TIGR03435 family)
LKKLLQAPAKTSLEALRGRAVILEFWATWCGPCASSMNHLSRLAERFKDKPVSIIAISSEEESDLLKYLRRRPAQMWIGVDDDEATFKRYQPRVIPHTVLIDREGKIAAITYPEKVTEQVIEDLLAGRAVNLPTKQYGYEKGLDEKALDQMQEKLDSSTIYKTLMRPSQSQSAWARFHINDSPFAGRRFEADGIRPLALLSLAYDTPDNRFLDEAGLPDGGYRVDVILPEGKEYLLRPMIQQLALTSFGITVERETRMMDVKVLKRIEGAAPLEPSAAEKPLYTFRGTRLTAIRQPIRKLIEYVGNGSKSPVIDETGLRGEYDFSMEWVLGDKSSFNEALHRLGFELVSERRTVEVLVIKRASRPVSL